MASILSHPSQLKLNESTDVNSAWKKFKQSWELYEIASETNKKSDEIRVATFLHIAGHDALEKYNGFNWNEGQDKNKIVDVIKKFDEDCQQKCNILLERHKFYSRKQLDSETCDQYITQLRLLATSCKFHSINEALRDQFSLNIKTTRAKEKILEKAETDYENLTIEKVIQITKMIEMTNINREKIEIKSDEHIYQTRHKKTASYHERKNRSEYTCSRCGTSHKFKECPAFGKQCSKCNKPNHFSRMCKARIENNSQRLYNSEINNKENDSEFDVNELEDENYV